MDCRHNSQQNLNKTLVKNGIYFFSVWLILNSSIYFLSKVNLDYLVELTFLHVAQVMSIIGVQIIRNKSWSAAVGSIFIISNYLIFKILDPFSNGIGNILGLASSLLALTILTKTKEERETK